jgi:hypothetical protein
MKHQGSCSGKWKYGIVLNQTPGEISIEGADAKVFQTGQLIIYDDNVDTVAAFAPGSWIRVSRQEVQS